MICSQQGEDDIKDTAACDLTGLYRFVSTSSALNSVNGGDFAQNPNIFGQLALNQGQISNLEIGGNLGFPNSNIGTMSLDCYKVPDALFDMNFGDNKATEFLDSFWNHPNMATGANFFDQCLDGVQDMFGLLGTIPSSLTGTVPLLGTIPFIPTEPGLDIPFQEEIASFCSTEIQGGMDLSSLLGDEVNLNPTFLGSSLTFQAEDLDQVYDFDGEPFDDFCQELAAHVFKTKDEETCFIAGAAGETGLTDALGLGQEGTDFCFPFCGYEARDGMLYIWMNTAPSGGDGRIEMNPFGRKLEMSVDETFRNRNLAPTLENYLVGYVMHKVSTY